MTQFHETWAQVWDHRKFGISEVQDNETQWNLEWNLLKLLENLNESCKMKILKPEQNKEWNKGIIKKQKKRTREI